MKFNTTTNTLCGLVAILAASLMYTTASAGTFRWGDIAGDEVMFLNVTENNNESSSLFAPMPGTGGPVALGNSLHLDPQDFASQPSNGSSDLIDSTLSTVIMAGPGRSIESIMIAEFGDYSLGGLIGGQATAEVGAAFFWTVLEIDNASVSLATQTTSLILGTGGGPNGGKYARPGDDGTAVIWSGTASIDFRAFLDSMDNEGDVTKVRLTFDNTLQTAADQVSNAFIKKKSIDIDVDLVPGVPEPATALLLGLGVVMLPCCRRR